MQKTLNEEMLGLERSYWNAVQRKDSATASKLSDEHCIVVGARGVGDIDRAQLANMLDQAKYELTHYAFDDKTIQVRKLTEDVAIVAYGVREDLVVDRKRQSVEAFDASVWVRRGNTWLCALHTESIKGDPFGRREIDHITS